MVNMRKILVLVFLLVSFAGIGQVVQFPNTYGIGFKRTGADSLLWIPSDTLTPPASVIGRSHIANKGGTLYYWNGEYWVAVAGGGSGTVTSVGSGYGLAGGAITTSGTLRVDSATIYPQIRQRFADGTTFKNDTITLTQLNTSATTSGTKWKRNSVWVSNSTETVLGSTLQVASSYNSSINTNSSISDTTWESCINKKTSMMDFKIVSLVGANSFVGLMLKGATNLFGTTRVGYININDYVTEAVYVSTYTGGHFLGNLSTPIAFNDVVRMYFTEDFDYYTIRVVNFTKNTDETFTYNEAGGTGTSSVTDAYPSILIQGCAATIIKYNYYGHNYRPDVMFLGSSISQNQKLNTGGYATSMGGYLQSITNRQIEMGAKSANELEDIKESLPEVIKMKPKMVIIEGGYNNNQSRGQAPSTWGPVYRALVDSLLNHGIKVVVEKIIPASNTTPAVVGAWIDSTYSNHPKVQILNLYNTTAIYNTGYTGNADPAYFSDVAVHPNSAGGNLVAQYIKTQLERLWRDNYSGLADVDTPYYRDNVIAVGDSTAFKHLQFKWWKLGSGFTFNADSSITATGTTPTLQQVLTAGSTLTGNNTIAGGAHDLTIDNTTTTTINAVSGAVTNSLIVNSAGGGFTATNGSASYSDFIVTSAGIGLKPHLGALNIDTLAAGGALSDSFMVWRADGYVRKYDGTKVVTTDATQTLTNKRWTPRVGSTTSSATPTINTDNVDIYKLTAQAADITSMTTNLSGTPVDGDVLEIQITGTAARAITWGASFVSSTVTLPATTVTTATLTVILQYYTTSSYGNNKWVCVNYY